MALWWQVFRKTDDFYGANEIIDWPYFNAMEVIVI